MTQEHISATVNAPDGRLWGGSIFTYDPDGSPCGGTTTFRGRKS